MKLCSGAHLSSKLEVHRLFGLSYALLCQTSQLYKFRCPGVQYYELGVHLSLKLDVQLLFGLNYDMSGVWPFRWSKGRNSTHCSCLCSMSPSELIRIIMVQFTQLRELASAQLVGRVQCKSHRRTLHNFQSSTSQLPASTPNIESPFRHLHEHNAFPPQLRHKL